MKTTFLTMLAVMAVGFGAAPARAQAVPGAAGHWEGEIQMPEQTLRLSVDLAPNASGVWIGSLSIPPTTTVDVPITGIAVNSTAVRFAAGLPGPTTFEGAMSSDGQSIEGTVTNALGGVPFKLARKGNANVAVPAPSSALPKPFEGTWQGAIEAGGRSMRIVLKLLPGAEGLASATLVNVDQANQEIPITTVTINDKELLLDARVVSGTYRGTLTDTGEILGVWSQGPASVPLAFSRVPPSQNP